MQNTRREAWGQVWKYGTGGWGAWRGVGPVTADHDAGAHNELLIPNNQWPHVPDNQWPHVPDNQWPRQAKRDQ